VNSGGSSDNAADDDDNDNDGPASLERIFEVERRRQNNCVLDSSPCGCGSRRVVRTEKENRTATARKNIKK